MTQSFARDAQVQCKEIDAAIELLKDASQEQLMIDVGAHHGGSLGPFLDRGWRIVAFEPDNINRGKLMEKLSKHKNKHLVSVDNRCVSNVDKVNVSFFSSEVSSGISSLTAFHDSHSEAQKVDVISLAKFFEGKPLGTVDFLKIDAEGHDYFVLQGFPWERCKPAVIMCEFEDIRTIPLNYSFHDMAQFLLTKGYSIYVSEWYPVIRYGSKHSWRQWNRYPCEMYDPHGWGNLLALREPVDEKVLVEAFNKSIKQ